MVINVLKNVNFAAFYFILKVVFISKLRVFIAVNGFRIYFIIWYAESKLLSI